jgi:hypothetical protein
VSHPDGASRRRACLPSLGATVYDVAAVYAKSSAIDYIKNVKTEMVIYPNEGRRFYTPAHQKDVLVRMIPWFNENLK